MNAKKQALRHTQGPWEAISEDETEWSIWYKYYLQGESTPRTSWLADSIYSEADARLIAAAPDLLESLKLMLEDARHDRITVEVFNRAVDIIAKAEGRQ